MYKYHKHCKTHFCQAFLVKCAGLLDFIKKIKNNLINLSQMFVASNVIVVKDRSH